MYFFPGTADTNYFNRQRRNSARMSECDSTQSPMRDVRLITLVFFYFTNLMIYIKHTQLLLLRKRLGKISYIVLKFLSNFENNVEMFYAFFKNIL